MISPSNDLIDTNGRVKCPKCGMPMRRKAGRGYDPFFSCTEYPKCKGSRSIDPRTNKIILTDKEQDDLFYFNVYRIVNS